MGFVENKYSNIKPIKQEHRNGCWAACLEWWMKANKFSTIYSQKALRQEADIKEMYKSDSTNGKVLKTSHKDYGVLEKHELIGLFNQPRFKMYVHEEPSLNPYLIAEALYTNGPIIVGYYDGMALGNHINVICGYDTELQFVEVMEPRTGRFKEKGLSEYLAGPDPLILGWKKHSAE